MDVASSSNGQKDTADTAPKNEWKDFSSYQKAEYILNHKADCSFVVGRSDAASKTFPCHQWILKNASEVIQTMLLNGHFKESRTPYGIRITDTDPDTFQKFLRFIYYGDIGCFESMDVSTIRDLIYLGKKYMISDLTDLCIAMIKQNLINVENCDLLCVFEYAYFVEDKNLIEKCKKAIVDRRGKPVAMKPFNFNINANEEKRPTLYRAKTVAAAQSSATQPSSLAAKTSVPTFGSSQPSVSIPSFAGLGGLSEQPKSLFGSTIKTNETDSSSQKGNNFNFPVSESPVGGEFKKIEATSNNVINFGMNKGDITACSYIYDLSPPIFYEFQKTLTNYIAELDRFNMIETYAKVNAYRFDLLDHVENSAEKLINNNEIVKNIINNEDRESDESINSGQEEVKEQANNTAAERNEMLNMMFYSINFLRMTAKEFCRGPRLSSLLSTEEKLNILTAIVNKT